MRNKQNQRRGARAQSSFELLITLSLGLAILLPMVVIAFIQLSNANVSISAIQAQQSASKLASIVSLVGAEGYPAKQFVELQMPPGVEDIYIGTKSNSVGHSITFELRAPNGASYVTQYTSVNVSGNLGGITGQGTYIVNVSAQLNCPSDPGLPCVYMTPVS
ncbi:MAG: hypothetical protein M1156_01895 [Candidatus Marsarchaeota archaeon]|jgi:hypothetical protein|nr:hypothetical protein [Candidatus Marsarchaeota archaeon]